MVGTSRSSIKDSVQLHQAHAKTPVHSNSRQPHDEGIFDNGNNTDDRDQDDDEDELQVTQNRPNPRRDNTRNSRKMLATSKSLPNMMAHTINSTASPIKRPRLSSSTSPSPPPLPSHPPLSHAPRSAPRRPPKRAPLSNRHPSGSQQTTLEKFFGGNAIKDNITRAETETQRPTKKARLERDADAAIGPQTTSSSIATETNQQNFDNRESPDPLNVISSPPNGDRVRTRHRSNTLTTSATAGNSAIPTETTTSRSSRNTAHPVIIADDATTTKPRVETGVDAQSKSASVTTQAPEKRSLRSHDGGSRSRSELALYFPNYEQIISLEPVKPEFLAPETIVTILDDLTESPLPLPTIQSGSPSRTRKQRKSIEQISPFGNPLINLHGVEKIELPKVEDSGSMVTDPLCHDFYFKAHRRHERQEKQLRNIEKERAQHEKIQLDRLLDELQGHDWLRVMGISGITESEKKLYEPKRDYFVKEVSALIAKFHMWKEEEKRRKHEREQMLLEAANAAAEKEESAVDEELSESEKPSSDIDSSELDAAAAQQLLQEARSATAIGATTSSPPTPSHPQPRRRLVDELTSTPPKSRSTHHRTYSKNAIHTTTNQDSPSNSQVNHPEIQEYDEDKPFTSFYQKRHLRDAAFSSSRRGGRNRSAFGQPLPELIEEREFELPSEILTSEIVMSLERKRRRLKRESRGG